MWLCNASVQFFCLTPSYSRTIRTNSYSSSIFIAFNPWEQCTQLYKIKNIKVKITIIISEMPVLAFSLCLAEIFPPTGSMLVGQKNNNKQTFQDTVNKEVITKAPAAMHNQT